MGQNKVVADLFSCARKFAVHEMDKWMPPEQGGRDSLEQCNQRVSPQGVGTFMNQYLKQFFSSECFQVTSRNENRRLKNSHNRWSRYLASRSDAKLTTKLSLGLRDHVPVEGRSCRVSFSQDRFRFELRSENAKQRKQSSGQPNTTNEKIGPEAQESWSGRYCVHVRSTFSQTFCGNDWKCLRGIYW
jgi:hypothetical protein